MDARLEAFSTPGIAANRSFDRLRRDLHDAAGPDRLATSRTLDILGQLRARADFLMEQGVDLYRGQGVGRWYIEVAQRLYSSASAIEEAAKVEGVLS